MGQRKVIDIRTRRLLTPEEVARRLPPAQDEPKLPPAILRTVKLNMGNIFSNRAYSLQRWHRKIFRCTPEETSQVRELLPAFGFHEFGSNRFDPGEFVLGGYASILAVRAFPAEEPTWLIQLGYYVCVNETWYFRREMEAGFEKAQPGQWMMLKANPKLFPDEE